MMNKLQEISNSLKKKVKNEVEHKQEEDKSDAV